MTWHPVVTQGEPQQAEQSLVSDYCRAEWKQVSRLRELYQIVLNDGFHGPVQPHRPRLRLVIDNDLEGDQWPDREGP
jgi:hypothetical protein